MEAMRHQLLEKRRNLDGSAGGGAGGGEEPRAKRSRWGGEEESRGAGGGGPRGAGAGGAGGEEDGQQDACRVFWSLQGKKRSKWLNQGEDIDIESLRRPKAIG